MKARKLYAVILGACTFGVVLIALFANQFITFSTMHSSVVEVELDQKELNKADVISVLSQWRDVAVRGSNCPDKQGSCWADAGEIRVGEGSIDAKSVVLLINTLEVWGVFDRKPSRIRHSEFVDRLILEFADHGYNATLLEQPKKE